MAGLRVSVTPDPADMAMVVRAMNALQKVGGKPRRALGRVGLFIIREARRLLRERIKEWGPHSGKLAKSLTQLLDDMSVVVGSNLIYAAIQQLGGEIRPKGHPYLAIPTQAHLRRSGVWPRDIPRESMKFVPNARIVIGSHSWTGPALVRVEDETRTGKDGKVRRVRKAGEVMFALVRRVKIKGREYLVFGGPARNFLLGELSRDATRAFQTGRAP